MNASPLAAVLRDHVSRLRRLIAALDREANRPTEAPRFVQDARSVLSPTTRAALLAGVVRR